MIAFFAMTLGAFSPTHGQAPSSDQNQPADSKAPGIPSKVSPRLLWFPCNYDGPVKDRLAASEKLSIEEYRKRGVTVVELAGTDLDKWREGAGKDHAKAHKYLQYVSYAKSVNADAVGGLDVFSLTQEMLGPDEDTKPGDYVHAWGIAIKGCETNFMIDTSEADAPRAYPISFDESDPWSIPLNIEPQACESGGGDFMAMMGKGRPLLGVTLEGTTVTRVVRGSAAESAGIAARDSLVSCGGQVIADQGDLSTVLGDKKPGDEIEIVFERDGQRTTKSVKLSDRAEVEAKLSPLSKPLPALVGKDIEGREIRLNDLKGKVVLLDFWATWCGPCVEEMPLMQLTWESLKDKGLVWVGVSADVDESAWRGFIKDNRIGGIQLREEEWVASMGVGGFPTIYLVDRGQVVRCNVRGGSIARAAAALLKE